MSTPPETPPVLPRRNVFQQLARASWVAPIFGVAVNIQMIGARIPPGSPFHLLGALFCVAGFICGVTAFFGIPKYGAKGILGHAIAGVGITGLMFVLAMMTFMKAKEIIVQRQEERQREISQAQQEGVDSFMNYSGWLGRLDSPGGMILVMSLDDNSQLSQLINSHFGRKVSVVNLRVENSMGKNNLAIDPYSLKIINADGTSHTCESSSEVFSSVSTDKEDFIANNSGLVSAVPGQSLRNRFGFFASGTGFSNVLMMLAVVNGREVTIDGKFLTPEQKMELFKRGKQIQNENQKTPQ